MMASRSSTDELIQNVIDTMDNAHTQKHGLSELMDSLQQAKTQVKHSAEESKDKVRDHFATLQKVLCDSLSVRLSVLLSEIETIEQTNLEPLQQCEDMISQALDDATQCLQYGKSVLADSPEENVQALLNFKDSPDNKNLNILPEVPSLSEVAYIAADFPEGLTHKLSDLVGYEGRIYERAPVQITECVERPGAVLVKWEEVDDEVEMSEFCLQYCLGHATATDLSKLTFHTKYTGPNTSCLVRNLRVNTAYSFRVRCRQDGTSLWRPWSRPRPATTSIQHYEWDSSTEGYSTSNEDKTGTRCSGLTRVLYSKTACYQAGFPVMFRVMDTGEKSPVDGLGISLTNDDIDTMKREGAIFLGMDGIVYVDGQEMKTRLPCLSRNSCVTIETESLPNGKVRVSVQVGDKDLTFDWKIDRQVTLSLIGGMSMMSSGDSAQKFFLGMHFSHEDWKIGVE